MSHGHSHPVEENPKVTSTGAFYFVLTLVGLVVGLFLFVQSMSGHDEHADGHDTEHKADAHAADKGHSWDHKSSLEFSSVALSGGKAVETKAAPVVVVVTNDSTSNHSDSTAAKKPATTDTTKVEKK